MYELRRPDRGRVTQLLRRLRGTEGHYRCRSTVSLDDPHRLFDRTLLVGAHRKAQLTDIDLELVRAQRDARADHGHSLDADENVHAQLLTREFSGSNSGVEPTTSTVTG